MSETATEAVQPEAVAAAPESAPVEAPAGQGGDATSGLYNLEQLPEGVREQVAPIFSEWEGNVTREFQKRAEAVKAWEPFDQMGLRDWNPEDVSKLLAFGELASDDEKFKSWVAEAYQALHNESPEAATAAPADAAAAAAAAGGEDKPLTMADVERLLGERESAATQQREQEQAINQAAQQIRGQLDGLKSEHGDNYGIPEGALPEGTTAEDLILHQATLYEGADAIDKAFGVIQRMLGAAEAGVLQQKLKEPAAPEKGGRADATAKPPATFAEAKARTAERVRQTQNL